VLEQLYYNLRTDLYKTAKQAQHSTELTGLAHEEKVIKNREFLSTLDVQKNSTIIEQNVAIMNFKLEIQRLTEALQIASRTIIELNEFAKKSDPQILNQELLTLKDGYECLKLKQKAQLDRLQNRHELSVKTTMARAERIITTSEGDATAELHAKLPQSIIKAELLNQKLKRAILMVSNDHNALSKSKLEIEQRNLHLTQNDTKYDWNLLYEQKSDSGNLQVFGSRSLLPPLSALKISENQSQDVQKIVTRQQLINEKIIEINGLLGHKMNQTLGLGQSVGQKYYELLLD
jgi:hypothetical protein